MGGNYFSKNEIENNLILTKNNYKELVELNKINYKEIGKYGNDPLQFNYPTNIFFDEKMKNFNFRFK